MLNGLWSNGKSQKMVLSRILELKSEKLAVCNVIASLVSFAKKAQSNPTMSCKCLHLLIVFFFFCYCPLSKLGLAHLLSPTTLIIELAKINTAPTRPRVRSQGLRFSYVFPLRNQTLIRHVYRDILFFYPLFIQFRNNKLGTLDSKWNEDLYFNLF